MLLHCPTVLLALVSLAWRPAIAACTPQEAKEKSAIAWDRASLLEMRDLEGGRSLHKLMLGMLLAGQTSGADVDFDKLCAQYDELTKAANEGLAPPRRRP